MTESAVAMELGDVVIVLDDKKARRVARSAGLRVIGTLGVLLRAKQRGVLPAPLYCVEEPENHLHPRLLETLIELLRQEQQAAGPQAAQVLATTPSPQLVDLVGLDALVIVDKRNGATACRRPEDRRELREHRARVMLSPWR